MSEISKTYSDLSKLINNMVEDIKEWSYSNASTYCEQPNNIY